MPVSPEMIEPLVRISISPTHGSKSFRRCVMIASPAVAVSMFERSPMMPRDGMSNSSRVRSPSEAMFVSVPLRRVTRSITVPEHSSGQSTVISSIGSHFLPSISLMMTCGWPTCNS